MKILFLCLFIFTFGFAQQDTIQKNSNLNYFKKEKLELINSQDLTVILENVNNVAPALQLINGILYKEYLTKPLYLYSINVETNTKYFDQHNLELKYKKVFCNDIAKDSQNLKEFKNGSMFLHVAYEKYPDYNMNNIQDLTMMIKQNNKWIFLELPFWNTTYLYRDLLTFSDGLEAQHLTHSCQTCHSSVKNNDFIFTKKINNYDLKDFYKRINFKNKKIKDINELQTKNNNAIQNINRLLKENNIKNISFSNVATKEFGRGLNRFISQYKKYCKEKLKSDNFLIIDKNGMMYLNIKNDLYFSFDEECLINGCYSRNPLIKIEQWNKFEQTYQKGH